MLASTIHPARPGRTRTLLPNRLLTRPFRRSRGYTFAEFLSELKILRLAGRTFDIKQYAQRLADCLGLIIKVVGCDDVAYPLLRAQLAFHGIGGGLFFEPQERTSWIVVPGSLDPMAQVLVAYHELGHIAGGHPFERRYLLRDDEGGESYGHLLRLRPDGMWEPRLRLARRKPPAEPEPNETLRACEEEANLRARYALKAGLYGEEIYYRDEFFFAVKDRRVFSFDLIGRGGAKTPRSGIPLGRSAADPENAGGAGERGAPPGTY